MSAQLSCQICTNSYGGKIIPTILTCCGEDICFDCGESDRVAKISNLTGRRKMIQCMLCNQLFHSEKDTPWIVNKPLIRSNGIIVDMSSVKEAQLARQGDTSTRHDTRRSQRTEEEEEDQSEDDEDGDHKDDGENYQRAPKRTRRTEEVSMAEPSTLSSQEESTQRPSRLQLSMTVDERQEDWFEALSRNNINFYRVRIFQNDSKKESDMFGRKCSFWCIKNGYIASASLVITVLPKEIQNAGAIACKDYIRSISDASLNGECAKKDKNQKHNAYYSLEKNTYTHTYKHFIEMRPGDIIAMQMKGKNKGAMSGPDKMLVFGVVQDDSFILLKKDEAREKHGFPWNFQKNGKDVRAFDNGIMLRKVKWYRYGTLYDVRGEHQADWLGESLTKWMVKPKLFDKAIRIMGSKKFIDNTCSIENEWIEVGLTGK